MTSVPGFLTKTFEIFSSPEFSDCCGWGANGETIIIRKIEQFSKQVLPKYFKHSNFQSFVRQLNMYDFHKTIQDPHHGEFVHEFFRQNKPELLVNIKRKANKPPEANSGKGKNTGKNTGGNTPGGTGSRSGAGNAAKGQSTNNNATKAAPINASDLAALTTNGNPLSVPQQLNSFHPNHPGNNVNNYPMGMGGSIMGNNNYNYNNQYPALMPPPNMMSPDSPMDLLPDIHLPESFVEEDGFHPGGPAYHPASSGSGGGGSGGGGGGYFHDPSQQQYDPQQQQQYGQHLPENIATETGGVMQELYQQRLARENFERRMEQKLASLQGENNMLKRMFMESHHKNAVMQERMERVMKTLYTMFVNGGSGSANTIQAGNNMPGMALTHRAPSMLITDMQHFLQQQKNSSDSEIELLEGMGVDTHTRASRPPLLPLPLSMSLENTAEVGMNRAGAGSSRGYISNNGNNSSSSSNNGGRSSVGQVVEIGSYSGSGLQGGLGRPIVLGNGQGDDEEDRDVHSEHLLLNDDEHRLLRLDSATLERLPSLDLDDLESIAAADDGAMVVDAPTAVAAPTIGKSGRKNSSSTATTSATTVTAIDAKPASGDVPPPGHYVHLLNRPMAGQALGDMKVTSFDIVAGAVTAPNLRQQSSFDGAYLPTPSDDFGSYFSRNNTNNSIHSNSSANAGLAAKPSGLNNSTVVPSGRVFLSTGDGQGGRTGSSSSSVGSSGGSGGGLPLGAAAGGTDDSGLSLLPQPLLARQRTFDASSILSNNGGDAASFQDPQVPKRRVESAGEGSNKKQKAGDKGHDISAEEEMSALGNEDVHSSLSEAQQFMDLLNRNQQTTLTRLDSLEQTIACLFDGPDQQAATAGAASVTASPATDGSNSCSSEAHSSISGNISNSRDGVKEETDVLSVKNK